MASRRSRVRTPSAPPIFRMPLLVGPVPYVSESEKDRSVVARVLISEARVRVMHDVHLQRQRAAFAREDVDAHINLRCEVDRRRVAGRDIVQREKRATRNPPEWRHFLPVRKVPFPEKRLDARAIDSAFRREYDVSGHHVHGPFEIPTQNSRQMLSREHQTTPPSGYEELRVIGFAEAIAAAGEDAQFPSAFCQRG